jgi:hypothetical protein
VLTTLGVDSGVQQLSAIEISDLVTNRVSDDDIADKTRHFQNTYTTLRDIARSKKPDGAKSKSISSPSSTHPAPPSNVLQKRGAISVSDQRPRKRSKSPRKRPETSFANEATTPNQTTVVPNPNFSGGTNESADEELTRDFIKSLLQDTRRCLSEDFRSLAWSGSGTEPQLALG